MSDLLDAAPPSTGELLGARYRLIERVGSGGMGHVYRARDEILGRDVAVKLFHTDGTDPADDFRKISEAKVLASLNHPSLVTLFDAHIEQGGQSYLVMEYVEGPTLRSRILSGPIEVTDAVAMTRDLAAGLEVVHSAGVIHRDIKPSNVMLRPAGAGYHAVLADFGVAHLTDSTRHTSPGMVIGTAAYLAPEQVRGDQPIPASDIYALGLLLIEALTGRHPFGEGSVQETLLARLARQPEVPGTLGYRWKSLLTAMTAPDPAERPTAAEVVQRAEQLSAVADVLEDPTALTTIAATRPVPVDATAVIENVEPEPLTEAMPEPTVEPAPELPLRRTVAARSLDAVEKEDDRHRQRLLWILIAAAVLALVIAGLVVMFASMAGVPAPQQLPELPAPLSEHMQQLLDGVSP